LNKYKSYFPTLSSMIKWTDLRLNIIFKNNIYSKIDAQNFIKNIILLKKETPLFFPKYHIDNDPELLKIEQLVKLKDLLEKRKELNMHTITEVIGKFSITDCKNLFGDYSKKSSEVKWINVILIPKVSRFLNSKLIILKGHLMISYNNYEIRNPIISTNDDYRLAYIETWNKTNNEFCDKYLLPRNKFIDWLKNKEEYNFIFSIRIWLEELKQTILNVI